jgi:hypothetical protein
VVDRQRLMLKVAAVDAHTARSAGRRRLLAAFVVVAVVLGHAMLGRQLARTMESWHEAPAAATAVDVVVEGSLKPAAPVRKWRSSPPQPAVALGPDTFSLDGAASATPADPTASQPQPPPLTAEAPPPIPLPEIVQAPPPGEPSRVIPADPWPPSTRIRYSLRGNYRGEFNGNAQVLWLRDGDRYRVELEVAIGPRVAPVMSRRVVSEGSLGPEGLVPRRYEEDTRVIFSRTRRVSMNFEPPTGGQPGTTVLQDGTRRSAPRGTQDSASQFVQLAWLFGTNPTPIKTGDKVSFPLALSRRSDVWSYVVGDPVTLETPAGPVQAIHAKPQRELDPLKRDMIAEIWFAPALQYLPVRMQVSVDSETYALMVMDGLPELVKQSLPAGGDRLRAPAEPPAPAPQPSVPNPS